MRHPKPGIDALVGRRIMSMALPMAATMNAPKSLYESLTDWLSFLGVGIRAALTSGTETDSDSDASKESIDPDFDGWLHGDPFVAANSASRYYDDAPGFVTRNGLGSLEIGAADD